jgi:hypothetical protein
MTEQPSATEQAGADEFAQQAKKNRPGLLANYWAFLRYEKRWWLTPVILLLLLLGLIIILGGTAAAPFIYTLF